MAAAPLPAPPEGVEVWRNADNRFVVAKVHYRADPTKRTDAWKRAARAGMPERGWLREYEINFSVPEGAPVFPEFQSGEMVRPLLPVPAARLLRFWDFGHVSPVCLFAQLDGYGRLLVLSELVLQYASLEMLIDAVVGRTVDLVGAYARTWDAGDPAAEAMTDLGQVRRELMTRGIILNTIRSRAGSYAALRQRLLGRTIVQGTQSPLILVDPACPVLIRALSGALHYSPTRPDKPVETHPWKDVVDALRYGNDNLAGARDDYWGEMQKMARIDRAW